MNEEYRIVTCIRRRLWQGKHTVYRLESKMGSGDWYDIIPWRESKEELAKVARSFFGVRLDGLPEVTLRQSKKC